jgi:hypothetical protein
VLKNSVDLYTLLIEAEGTKTPVGVWFRGDPAGACSEEARRNTHGKRSAWSGNQQAILTEPISKIVPVTISRIGYISKKEIIELQ